MLTKSKTKQRVNVLEYILIYIFSIPIRIFLNAIFELLNKQLHFEFSKLESGSPFEEKGSLERVYKFIQELKNIDGESWKEKISIDEENRLQSSRENWRRWNTFKQGKIYKFPLVIC